MVCPKPTSASSFLSLFQSHLSTWSNIPHRDPMGRAELQVEGEEGLQAMTTHIFLRRPNTAQEKTILGNLEVHPTVSFNSSLFRISSTSTMNLENSSLSFNFPCKLLNYKLGFEEQSKKTTSKPLRMKCTWLVPKRIPPPLSLMALQGFYRVLSPQSGKYEIFLHFLIIHISRNVTDEKGQPGHAVPVLVSTGFFWELLYWCFDQTTSKAAKRLLTIPFMRCCANIASRKAFHNSHDTHPPSQAYTQDRGHDHVEPSISASPCIHCIAIIFSTSKSSSFYQLLR